MNKIKIGPYTFDIEYVDLKDEEGEEIYGHVCLLDKKISILEKSDSDLRKETIIHETLHIISDLLGTEFTENQIIGLSHYIFMVLKDNPDLLKKD